jgi:hypothetical protein
MKLFALIALIAVTLACSKAAPKSASVATKLASCPTVAELEKRQSMLEEQVEHLQRELERQQMLLIQYRQEHDRSQPHLGARVVPIITDDRSQRLP